MNKVLCQGCLKFVSSLSRSLSQVCLDKPKDEKSGRHRESAAHQENKKQEEHHKLEPKVAQVPGPVGTSDRKQREPTNNKTQTKEP